MKQPNCYIFCLSLITIAAAQQMAQSTPAENNIKTNQASVVTQPSNVPVPQPPTAVAPMQPIDQVNNKWKCFQIGKCVNS